ncbi:hypothetical protein ABB37_07668 [Leptomonas pyrrhocoris]|uniref:Uncharacterized protein n=1 Tax=Leptomonas pyrrhocoris TaxID=157538 RepID=A0A0M9FVR3_LEPPY|nr:hypothetical protein ABB37_07668 [Leptomonas pyrrhocoris]KPA76876.1 hypothetical protein ABB37_07668 [Leptomonas pyrrhocoris]|eukprot:XP_015655315.1 hypothetical protein ABB37_07668 [Leptomonas pyrrhocoris]
MAGSFLSQRPLLMMDSRKRITEAAVLHQLAELTDRAGFISPLWFSYNLARRSNFNLKPQTVPVNVWHPLCGNAFCAAHPAHSTCIFPTEETVETPATGGNQLYVLSDLAYKKYTWVSVCPSISQFFQTPRSMMAPPYYWVPTRLSRIVPVYVAQSITLPPFLTLVNLDQLEESRGLTDMLQRVSSPR